jgi:hypothetical protein
MEEDFIIEDFTLDIENFIKDFNKYDLNKDYFIFNKPVLKTDYISYKLSIYLNKNKIFSEYILKINNYLKLLNCNVWENKLVKYFCDFYNEENCLSKNDYINVNKLIDDKWFENLEVWNAVIRIGKDEKITSTFICKDDYGPGTFVLKFCANENDLYGMEYDYMGDGWG